jgi:biotin carboxyl carrier protein
VPLSDDDVREILRIIDESPLEELRIETEGFTLYVARGRAGRDGPAQLGVREGIVTIDAPLVGTFYRAPGPGEEPFVDVGSRVSPETTVCIVESMKMMNSVHAGLAGTIVEVLIENATPVEYEQPLFKVEPT